MVCVCVCVREEGGGGDNIVKGRHTWCPRMLMSVDKSGPTCTCRYAIAYMCICTKFHVPIPSPGYYEHVHMYISITVTSSARNCMYITTPGYIYISHNVSVHVAPDRLA